MPRKYTEDEILDILENSETPWEKQEFETESAYRLFSNYYLKLPMQERNIMNAYNKYRESVSGKLSDKPSNSWYKWADKHHWVFRSDAHDIYVEEEMQQYVRKDQFTELVEFRKRQRELAGKIANAALLMIDKAIEALEDLESTKISASNIANYFKTAAQIAEMASNAEASTMALNDIIERLNVENKDYVIPNDIDDENTIGRQLKASDDREIIFDILDEVDY